VNTSTRPKIDKRSGRGRLCDAHRENGLFWIWWNRFLWCNLWR